MYMFMTCHQNTRQNHSINIPNKSFKSEEEFKYLRMPATNQNFFHEEIICRLNLGSASYQSVKNLLLSHFQSKEVKITHAKLYLLLCMDVKCGFLH
jgi:hypothetical protein